VYTETLWQKTLTGNPESVSSLNSTFFPRKEELQLKIFQVLRVQTFSVNVYAHDDEEDTIYPILVTVEEKQYHDLMIL
jgi:hypothetical protein